MKKNNQSELLANYFVAYLFSKYKGSLHVRRVATWIGFLLKAIERLPGVSFSRRRERQVSFEYRGQQFKVRFNHKVGSRGGIEIVEVLPDRGSPEGNVIVSIKDLNEAENTYLNLKIILDKFTH